jgi:putative Mn2+ efflux pump MntP
MLALILVAAAVGFSNLAASVGVGAGGVDLGIRLRVVVIFGLLEAGMPVVGLLIGHGLAGAVGRQTRWLAAMLLIAVGGYGIVSALRGTTLRASGATLGPGGSGSSSSPRVSGATLDRRASTADAEPGRGAGGGAGPGAWTGTRRSLRLLATGFALSMDNLVAGFALGAYQVGIAAGALVFGVVSAAMSLVGLEFGALIGKRISGSGGEIIGGAVLIGVGVAIGIGVLG